MKVAQLEPPAEAAFPITLSSHRCFLFRYSQIASSLIAASGVNFKQPNPEWSSPSRKIGGPHGEGCQPFRFSWYWTANAAAHICAGVGWPRIARRSIRTRSGLLLKSAAPGGAPYFPHCTRGNRSLQRRIGPARTDPIEPGETRRNVVVEGVDVYALLHREFRIGAVRLSGSEPTLPCRIPSAVAGKTGFAEAYHGRGGIRAEVLSDGIISIGDFIQTDLSK